MTKPTTMDGTPASTSEKNRMVPPYRRGANSAR